MLTKRTIGLVALTGLAAGSICAVLLTADKGQAQFESRPSRVAVSHEIDDASSPEELFAHADAVVVGTVTGWAVGKTWGERVPERETARLVDLKITKVMKSAAASDEDVAIGNSIHMVEGYWDGHRNGFVLDNVSWSEPGSVGVYFLHRMDGESTYRLVNSYGRLLYGESSDSTPEHGPSGVDPLNAIWRPAKDSLGDLDGASAYVSSLAAGRPPVTGMRQKAGLTTRTSTSTATT